MAAQCKLVRRCDFSDDISSLSLYGDEEGFSLAWNGWEPAIAGDDDLRVEEAMTLQVNGDDHDDLAAKLRLLDDKIREVGWYKNSVERYGIWLRTQLANETYARQALITKADRSRLGSSAFNPSVSPGSYLGEYQLALERMPWWEPQWSTAYQLSPISCLGGTFDYSTYLGSHGAVVGNVPSRIALTVLMAQTGGGGPLYEFWFGFRTDRFGDRANFVSTWQCESGTLANTTIVVALDTASGGGMARCTFSDTTMKPRVTISVEDVTTEYRDQRGSFTVLLRARVSSSTACRVRLLDGFSDSEHWRTQQRVAISSTNWMLYALGTVNIPPSTGRASIGSFLRKFSLRIEAERTSGSDLDMDCLILIPTAEGAMHVTGGAVEYDGGDFHQVVIQINPDGTMDGWGYSGTYPTKRVSLEPGNYNLPVGSGILVFAAQREDEHVRDDTMGVNLITFPRWRTLRGDE